MERGQPEEAGLERAASGNHPRYWPRCAVAGISEGPHALFRLGPAENGQAQCFAVQRGSISGRVNADYFHPERLLALRALRQLAQALDCPRLAQLVDFIRHPIQSPGPGCLSLAHVQSHTGELVPTNRKVTGSCFVFQRGDVLFARWGAYLNKVHAAESDGGSSPEFHVLRVKNHEALHPDYLAAILRSNLTLAQTRHMMTGITHPRLTYEDVVNLVIPLPDIGKQARLVSEMDAARAERRAKLAEANALLADFDSYLLATLGLALPPKDERKVFAVRKLDCGSQARLNADYFHPERILALHALEHSAQALDCPRLAQLVDFIRHPIQSPGPGCLSLAHVQSHTGELVLTNKKVTGTCFVFQRGDVLFARLGAYLNKVHAAESGGCCSPEFYVLRIKDSKALHPDYLAAILRSSLTLAQTQYMMTGNTHPRLTHEDVTNLVLPVPTPAVQETIAAEARRRREEARRLRAGAEAGWQAAKCWFEAQLLGPAPP